MPKETDFDEKLERLNDIHPNVKITIETEEEGKRAFLDTCIVKTYFGFRFKVTRKKAINRENYVHFYSAHSDRINTGIVIGFFFLEHLDSATKNA